MPAFLISPMIKAGLILAFILGVFGSGYLMGKRAADQTARIAELERDSRGLTRERDTARAERDEVRRQAEAATVIAAEAAKSEQAVQAEKDELEGMIREFEKLPRNRSCGFSDDVLKRLRPIYDRAIGAGSASPNPPVRP